MYYFANNFSQDVKNLAGMDSGQFFEFVKSIPYENDSDKLGGPDEILARPKYLLNFSLFPRLDCKKKSILFGAFFYKKNIPYRFLAVSERTKKTIHHVFPQAYIDGWRNFDATYPDDRLGAPRPQTTRVEVLTL